MAAGIEDYSAAIVIRQMVRAPQLRGGHPVQKNGNLVRYAGGFCVVYPFEAGKRKYAVRCWHTPVDSVQGSLDTILSAVARSRLKYFVPCSYVKDAILTANGPQPALVMDWVEAPTLKRYIGAHLDDRQALDRLAESFLVMVKDLHNAGISHGDLQHGNILVQPGDGLTLVDYDSMYVPGMHEVQDEIKGLAGYQHPARLKQRYRSEVSDYFSELVIYTSIRTIARHPILWKRYNLADTETMLFTEADILSRGASEVFRIIEQDREIRHLGRAVRDALRETSLERILPLENVAAGQAEALVESLSRRWESNGFQFSPMLSNMDIFNQLNDICSRW